MTKTKTGSPSARRPLRPDKFVRFEDFPVDCDSQLEKCFGHTTEVIRGRIATKQLIALFKLQNQTSAAFLKCTAVVSVEDDKNECHEQNGWREQFYKYVPGGARAGS